MINFHLKWHVLIKDDPSHDIHLALRVIYLEYVILNVMALQFLKQLIAAKIRHSTKTHFQFYLYKFLIKYNCNFKGAFS